MENKSLPMKVLTIKELFFGEMNVYEIPIYQRNYAWEKKEIDALVRDVHDAFIKDNNENKTIYYIGTLVSYNKGDQVYEIIDGQQRLTTIRLILDALNSQDEKRQDYKGCITYRARKKSDETLKSIPEFDIPEKDIGIENGFQYAKNAIDEIVENKNKKGFQNFFVKNVGIIHYQVPKDIDLNHYFEIMNSRGEQLEKHEIVKARLMGKLENSKEKEAFNKIWECCSEMSVYIQQKLGKFDRELADKIFDNDQNFIGEKFDEFVSKNDKYEITVLTIEKIIKEEKREIGKETGKDDMFLPIIDFQNFLLIVLKITMMEEGKDYSKLILDDKELIDLFDSYIKKNSCIKRFAFNLLKARFFLDNYVVHHVKEDEKIDKNPWKLEKWEKDYEPKILSKEANLQDRLVQLLSMFEVTYSAKQRKNYLFYCLLYLFKKNAQICPVEYANFLENLACKFLHEIYLCDIDNVIFDDVVLNGNELKIDGVNKYKIPGNSTFEKYKGNGNDSFIRIPLFVFNYLDYKLWKYYADALRGKNYDKGNNERKEFFKNIGCNDFGLEVFDKFYFSGTRNSLEHFYPRANVNKEVGKEVIERFGNYAMIGSAANSSGSNWSPIEKVRRYLDSSKKINPVSVSSLKFRIMMQICKDGKENEWKKNEIVEHERKMIYVLICQQPADGAETPDAVGEGGIEGFDGGAACCLGPSVVKHPGQGQKGACDENPETEDDIKLACPGEEVGTGHEPVPKLVDKDSQR